MLPHEGSVSGGFYLARTYPRMLHTQEQTGCGTRFLHKTKKEENNSEGLVYNNWTWQGIRTACLGGTCESGPSHVAGELVCFQLVTSGIIKVPSQLSPAYKATKMAWSVGSAVPALDRDMSFLSRVQWAMGRKGLAVERRVFPWRCSLSTFITARAMGSAQ